MSTTALRAVVDRFRSKAGRADVGVTDGQLLTRFVTHRDESAFAELVARLGPVVFAVCHRLLGDRHAAEDAFQVTFIVLARKAQTVRPPEAVGGWVYGVARKAALEASAVKHRRHETLVSAVPDSPAANNPDSLDPDILAALDAEIAALSEPYRNAVVLCELRGVSRKEAARHLGIPEGTLSSRLAAARQILGDRLRARGIRLSAGALAAALAEAGRAAVLPELRAAAVQAAVSGHAPEPVSTITREVLRSLTSTKLKWLAAGFVLVTGLMTGLVGLRSVPQPAPLTAAPIPAAAKPKIWLLGGDGRLTTINPDGSNRRQTQLKEGRLVWAVSPAQNLVWLIGRDGKLPDPVPKELPPWADGSGWTLLVRPLDDQNAKVTDVGAVLDPTRAFRMLFPLPGGLAVSHRLAGPGSPEDSDVLIDPATLKRTPFSIPGGKYVPLDLSPDGSWMLTYEMTDAEAQQKGQPQYRLNKIGRDGKPILLSGQLTAGFPGRISPDGRQVLAHGSTKVAGAKQEWQGATYLIEVATGKATKISGEANQWWSQGVWSPDGKRVAYIWGEGSETDEAARRRLVVCDADGANAEVIATPAFGERPMAWW